MSIAVYQSLARLLMAKESCIAAGNKDWEARHSEKLQELVRDKLPSGSGIDTATTLGEDSKPNRIVLRLSFHHMDEFGGYDGWTDHAVIVTPDLAFGFDVRVTGRDRNEIKDYLAETYSQALRELI